MGPLREAERKDNTLTAEESTFRLSPEKLSMFGREQDAKVLIGQERALKALAFGTSLGKTGYNIFVTGPTGTGRHTAVRQALKECVNNPNKSDHTRGKRKLQDICYVYNFSSPEQPRTLTFPPGHAAKFKSDLHDLVEDLKSAIRMKVESDYYQGEKDQIISVVDEEENRRLADFETSLADSGFRIIQVAEEGQRAADLSPIHQGEPVSFDTLQQMVETGDFPKEEWNRLREDYYRYMDEMKALFHELKMTRETMKKELEALKSETIAPAVLREVEKVRGKYSDPKVLAFINAMEDDILDHLFLFVREAPEDPLGNPALIRYGVNILKQHVPDSPVPIIFEDYPTYKKLFGSIDYKTNQSGETRSSFMMVRPGSLVHASGGFLILEAEHLQQENTWKDLKRVLKTGKMEIQEHSTAGPFPGSSLQPEAVEMDLRVIILGTEELYELLYEQDEDIQKLFKVSAEFTSTTNLNDPLLERYVGFFLHTARERDLLPLEDSALAGLVEYGVRSAEDRNKITTRFSLLTDLLTEVDYWARKNGRDRITRKDVERAKEERRGMFNLPEEQLDELIIHKDIILQTEGRKVGQVNGIALYERGYYTFGRPVVISARTAPGNEGVVNIEREVGLSGEIHDKGILIMEGYLRSTYARDFPLSIFASICFEQSYSEVDGDSASSSEMYALLSSIADLPLRQDIGVTGSLNQMGFIQAVGGITEKVEGFYRICKKMGLTGTQGILIPEKNRINLVLEEEVVEAIRSGQFHIYPVTTVMEGMEILTGKMSGQRDDTGEFPEDTFNGRIQQRLREMAEQMKSFNG